MMRPYNWMVLPPIYTFPKLLDLKRSGPILHSAKPLPYHFERRLTHHCIFSQLPQHVLGSFSQFEKLVIAFGCGPNRQTTACPLKTLEGYVMSIFENIDDLSTKSCPSTFASCRKLENIFSELGYRNVPTHPR